MSWKAFTAGSLNVLLSKIAQVKRTVDDVSSTVSGLGEDLVQLSELVERDIAKKQDKPKGTTCSIPKTGWVKDSNTSYPYYYYLSVTGITAQDRVDVLLAPASVTAAVSCGLCPTSETLAGKVRLRAVSAPTAVISAAYWIEQGKE